MIKLVLSDMDDTLLPFGRDHVSARTVAAIHACQECGIDFGPASGRDYAELASFFQGDVACYSTGVLVNGQKVYYQGELVFQKHLDAGALCRAASLVAQRADHLLVVYREDGFGDWVGMDRGAMGPMYDRAFIHGGTRHVTLPDYPVTKAGIMCPKDHATTVDLIAELQELCPECDFVNTVPGWLDVVPRGWSKVKGREVLAEKLKLATDEVCVFGDAENDLAMLAYTENSCAVGNATDAAKAAARWRVGASADDGVAVALEHIAHSDPIGVWARH